MKYLTPTLLSFAMIAAVPALACEYKQGETKFVDYAHCVYGQEQVQVVDLPEDTRWEQCVYRVQAFMPPKLLAITRQKEDGTEEATVNARGAIGNPCYLMKARCDSAFEAQVN